MAKSAADVAVTIDTPSYNAALDDVVAMIADITANVTGPMPENVWLQVVRWQVDKLRKG